MKITKISASIARLDSDGIQKELLKSPALDKALAILNQAYGKRNLDAFQTASENPRYVNDAFILKLIAKVISENPQNDRSVQMVRNILDYLQTEPERAVRIQLNAAATSNPKIASAILLMRPPIQFKDGLTITQFDGLTSTLITGMRLSDSKIWHPVFDAMLDDLEAGDSWNNCTSAYLFVSNRLFRTRGRDDFMVAASKYDFDPVAAVSLINTAKTYESSNPTLYKNVKENTNSGIEIARTCANKEDWEAADPDIILPKFIDLLQKYGYNAHSDSIWELLKQKLNQTHWELKCFQFNYNGGNVIDLLLESNSELLPELIDFVGTSANLDTIKRTSIYERIIHEGLNNPAYRDKVLSLPQKCFSMLMTSPEDAAIIREHFTPTQEYQPYEVEDEEEETSQHKPQHYPKSQPKPQTQPKPHPKEVKPEAQEDDDIPFDTDDITDIISSNKSWYIKYAEAQELLKEAGWKENLLMAAVFMVLNGATPAEASKAKNVDIRELSTALQNFKQKNPNHKQRNKYMQPSTKQIDVPVTLLTILSTDDLFEFIVKNEGYSKKAYLDPSKKNMVIGVGCNLDTHRAIIEQELKLNYKDVRSGKIQLTDAQIKKLFDIDAQAAINIAKRFVNNFDQLPTDMKKVLVDMAFNMGEGGISQFKKLKNAVERSDFQAAAKEMKDSKWFAQVKNRGVRAVNLVANLTTPSPALAKL